MLAKTLESVSQVLEVFGESLGVYENVIITRWVLVVDRKAIIFNVSYELLN
jgi:hypothetical protein